MPLIKNAKGQLYPWAIPGRDYAMCESLIKYEYAVTNFAGMLGYDGEMKAAFDNLFKENNERDEDPLVKDVEEGKIANAHIISGTNVKIKVDDLHSGYTEYFTADQEQRALEFYETTKKVVNKVSEHYRNLYVGKTDSKSLYLQEKANDLADWFDTITEISDPKAGNIVEAEMYAPYLSNLNIMSSSMPRFDSKGVEMCVDVLEQKGVEGGQNVYDDYMTLMTAGARETKLQYERQKMENIGWDAEKEATYLKKLRLEHEKSVNAFDRLWEVKDNGQYDAVLNNNFADFCGKIPGKNRDYNDCVGYMRGEMRAIDLGYDSKHLDALGQIGMQEQTMRKQAAILDYKLDHTESQEEKEKIKEQKKHLEDYQKQFKEFKDTVWNKRVNSKEEMEAVGKQVDEFFAARREKYAAIQTHRDMYVSHAEYLKECEKATPVLKHPNPALTAKDATDELGSAYTALQTSGIDSPVAPKYATVCEQLETGPDGFLTPESENQVKSIAGEFAEAIDQKIAELEQSKEHPNATAYQKASLLAESQTLDNLRKGILVQDDSPMADDSFSLFKSMSVEFDSECLSPENIASTDKAVKEIGFDQFGMKALDLQKKHQNFELNKDVMTPAERQKAYKELNDAKKDMIKQCKEMQNRLKTPSDDVKKLFVKEQQLKDFLGIRGLQGTIDRYSEDIMKVDIPQADKLQSALDKFNVSRAFVFKKESDDHKIMREMAEQVQKDMDQLKKGTIKDQTSGKERTMTEEEKKEAMKEAWKNARKLDAMSDKYIEHATKKGTKTPRTPAGKDRLEGAREIKALAGQMKAQLAAQPELMALASKEKQHAQRVAMYGRNIANVLSSFDKEVKKFKDLSTLQFIDSDGEASKYELNNCEYQAAKVIAIAKLTKELKPGQVTAESLLQDYSRNVDRIARSADFQKWIHNVTDNHKMKELGKKSPQKVSEELVNSMSISMPNDNPKKENAKEINKTHEKTDMKKEEKIL